MNPLIFYVVLGVLGAVAFYFAVQSRKSYTCPNCGEKVKTEYMEANRCGLCGSKIKEDKS